MRIAIVSVIFFALSISVTYSQCYDCEDSIFVDTSTVDFGHLRVGQYIRFNLIFGCDYPEYSPSNNPTIDTLLFVLRKNPMTVWEVGAYSDCRASREYNERLTTGRARFVWELLIEKGISQSRLTYHGYGENKLLNNCGCEPNDEGPGANCTEAEHQVNRRYELTIIKMLDSTVR